jgi:hypothetical protein
MRHAQCLLGSSAAPTHVRPRNPVQCQIAATHRLKRATYSMKVPQAAALASEQAAGALSGGTLTVPATCKAWHITNQVSRALALLCFVNMHHTSVTDMPAWGVVGHADSA